MKEKTKAYIAGVFDAEGCARISKTPVLNTTQYQASLKISNKSKSLMKYLVKHCGGAFTIQPNNDGWIYEWVVTNSKHAVWFLSLILPYVQIKFQELNILLEYYDMNGVKDPQRRDGLYQRMTELKDRSVETKTRGFSCQDNLINAYYSGLLDGEGELSISNNHPRKRIAASYYGYARCKNTFKPIIDLMGVKYNGRISTIHTDHPTWASQRIWRLDRRDQLELFLLKMLPYLIIKREQAKLLLLFLRLKCGPQEEPRKRIYEQMQAVNHPKENMI